MLIPTMQENKAMINQQMVFPHARTYHYFPCLIYIQSKEGQSGSSWLT